MNDLFFFLRFHRSHFHHCRVVSLLAYIESSRYRERLCWFFCVFNICFKVFIFMQVNMVWSVAMVRHTSHAHCTCTVHSWKWWRQNYCNKITFFNTNRCIAFIAILRRNCVFMTIYDFIFWIIIIIIIEEVGAADIFIEYSLFYWKNHFASVRIRRSALEMLLTVRIIHIETISWRKRKRQQITYHCLYSLNAILLDIPM